MEDELIYQTFLNKSEDFAEFRAARAEERNRTTGVVMPEFPPPGPTTGRDQRPVGRHLRGHERVRRGGGTGLGKRSPRSSPASRPTSSSPRAKPEHLEAGEQAITDLGARIRRSNATSAT